MNKAEVYKEEHKDAYRLTEEFVGTYSKLASITYFCGVNIDNMNEKELKSVISYLIYSRDRIKD